MLFPKTDFPLFASHPELVYLDSAATTQKPQVVIDGVQHFLTHTNANIHRGRYTISERAEQLYREARQTVARFFNADPSEIIFTNNSTDASNKLVKSLILS
jgi:cysteine desulfurase/selenocysteine lyase